MKDNSQDSGFSDLVPESGNTRGDQVQEKRIFSLNSILDISIGTWNIQVELFHGQLSYGVGVERNVAWSYLKAQEEMSYLAKVYRCRGGKEKH